MFHRHHKHEVQATDNEKVNKREQKLIVHQGWVLKKRRKMMQGYGRRYFVLFSTGILQYSFEPEMTPRDQIFLSRAAIATTPGRKDIHVDSDNATFHMKCLTTQDFEKWMEALRKFKTPDTDLTPIRSRSQSRGAELSFLIGTIQSHVEDMDKTINAVREAASHAHAKELHSVETYHGKEKSEKGRKKDRDHREGPFALFKKGHEESHSRELSLTVNRIESLMDALRDQHSSLKRSFADLVAEIQTKPSRSNLPLHGSIVEEPNVDPTAPTASGSVWRHGQHRSSMSTLHSLNDHSSIWFDAIEGEDPGVEEFFVEPEDMLEEETGAQSNDKGSEFTSDTAVPGSPTTSIPPSYTEPPPVISLRPYRTELPTRPPPDTANLFGILKKSVGQDLSNISFPVTFNEPLSLLQRMAEELEYRDLLEKAVAATNDVERMCYVTAFAVSGYACTRHRSGRKGFTPMLGETFEDMRSNFLAEKVSHKPLIMAFRADGPGWELNGTSSGKTKFWGKSLEIIPTGYTTLTIGGDRYRWNKPSSFTRNLMIGTKYLEHCGEMVITNETSGLYVVLEFKETGFWATTPNEVAGVVLSPDGEALTHLEGKWDEKMSQKLDASHLRVLWSASPFPRNSPEYYGFTTFAITLNELHPDFKHKLPPTDSRLRPDVRALEDGNVELAEVEKARLEEMQRERRRQDQEVTSRWFRPGDGDEWVYRGGYWEERERNWKNSTIAGLW